MRTWRGRGNGESYSGKGEQIRYFPIYLNWDTYVLLSPYIILVVASDLLFLSVLSNSLSPPRLGGYSIYMQGNVLDASPIIHTCIFLFYQCPAAVLVTPESIGNISWVVGTYTHPHHIRPKEGGKVKYLCMYKSREAGISKPWGEGNDLTFLLGRK
ncbi:hypothetical protein GGS20DRAFT_82557 [Poronia punctata]|nr:hypothetical protein GGS20DRAFT_82557 [Poronia punctata]